MTTEYTLLSAAAALDQARPKWSSTYTDRRTGGMSATEKECSQHLTRIDRLQDSSPNHPDVIYTKWCSEFAKLGLTSENQRRWGYHATVLAFNAGMHRSDEEISHSEVFRSEVDAQDYRKQHYLQPALQIVYCVAAEKSFFPEGLDSSDLQIHKTGTLNNCSESIPHFTLTYKSDHPIWTEEVKRETVLDASKQLSMMNLSNKPFPKYGWLDNPDPEICIWVQVYTQMYLQKVEFATLWSPTHIMFIHRTGTELQVSPFYPNDTHATIARQAAFYLEALERASTHVSPLRVFEPSTPYRLNMRAIVSIIFTEYPRSLLSLLVYWPNYFLTRWRLQRARCITAWLGHHQEPLPAQRILHDSVSPPLSRSTVDTGLKQYVGRGLVGHVFKSRCTGLAAKVYDHSTSTYDQIENEYRLMLQASTLEGNPAPRVWGVYRSDFGRSILVMDDAGESVAGISELDVEQKTTLLDHIKVLHAAGIHHHDIRADNIVINGCGKIKLVDFHTSIKVSDACDHCPDEDVIRFLENELASTRKT